MIDIDLPEVFRLVWNWITETGWPVIAASFTEPILWLAMAGLVMGYHIITFADLLRRGDLAAKFGKHGKLSKAAETLSTNKNAQTGLLQVQDFFFGDLDDKYLPIVQMVRLLLRTGVGALGALVVLYNVLGFAQEWGIYGLRVLIGTHDVPTSNIIDTYTDFGASILFEPLRLCLLACAYWHIMGQDRYLSRRGVQPDAVLLGGAR
jgi:hypothetical protein